MSKSNTYTVYRLLFPNGKLYYGITIDFVRRMKDHPRQAKFGQKSRPLFRAINKYGWENVKKEILCTHLSTEDAYDIEIELIRLHDTTNFNNGYNRALGGRTLLGCKHGPNKSRGRKLTEEHRRSLIAAKKGKSYSVQASYNSTIYSVKAINRITGEEKVYRNVTEFAKAANTKIHTVYNHIRRESDLLNKQWTVRKFNNSKKQYHVEK